MSKWHIGEEKIDLTRTAFVLGVHSLIAVCTAVVIWPGQAIPKHALPIPHISVPVAMLQTWKYTQ